MQVRYDECKRMSVAVVLQNYFDDGWQILKMDLIEDGEFYAIVFTKDK